MHLAKLSRLGRVRSFSTAVRTVQASPYAQTHTSAAVVNLGIGQPSPSLLPLALFQQAAAHALRDSQDPALFQYGAGAGFVGFRHDLAAFLSETQASPVDADTLLVTTGNSQALSHTAMLFARHNRRVFVEAPTYFLAFDIFRELGLDVAAVPVDAHGLDVDALEKRLKGGDVPAFIYTIPTFHNPTGTELSPERRTRLLALADAYAFRIISDEPYNLLRLDALPTRASLASLDPSGRVVSLGSFSKILSPGLRLGWAQSSRDTIRELTACGAIRSGGGQNPVTAAMVHSVLQLGLLHPHIQTLRQVFATRKATLCAALAEFCPHCAFDEPQGGYFVWVQLPRGVDGEQLLAEAVERHGVAFTPGARCLLPDMGSLATDSDTHATVARSSIRVSFAFYDDDELRVGVKRLGKALEAVMAKA